MCPPLLGEALSSRWGSSLDNEEQTHVKGLTGLQILITSENEEIGLCNTEKEKVKGSVGSSLGLKFSVWSFSLPPQQSVSLSSPVLCLLSTHPPCLSSHC